MEYIKDVFIPETNKHLNSAMKLSDYFCVISCSLIMDCYVGHYVRDFFLKYPITPQKCAPICLNDIIYGRSLDKITQVTSYKKLPFLSSMILFSKEADAGGVEQEHGSTFLPIVGQCS